MKEKSLFAIIATIVLAWALWSGALASCFEKIRWSGGSIVLKIDKGSPAEASVERFFRNTSVAIQKLSDRVFSAVGGSALIQQCKDQPVLFGALFIFFGVSVCCVLFIIHMIRIDSRFS